MNISTSLFSLPIVLSFVFLCTLSDVSFADIAPTSKHASEEAETTDTAEELAVLKNADGSVSINVKNIEIIHVSEGGIRINGNIEYTGVITDLGSLPQEDGDKNGE